LDESANSPLIQPPGSSGAINNEKEEDPSLALARKLQMEEMMAFEQQQLNTAVSDKLASSLGEDLFPLASLPYSNLLESSPQEIPTGSPRKKVQTCGNCKGKGHNRTDKKCPWYNTTEEVQRRQETKRRKEKKKRRITNR